MCGWQGERRRKAVRGCIVSADLSVLNLIIVKKGETDLPGLTDEEKPRLRGPKRASKIRKLFNLSKEDDVRKYVNTYRKVRSVLFCQAFWFFSTLSMLEMPGSCSQIGGLVWSPGHCNCLGTSFRAYS